MRENGRFAFLSPPPCWDLRATYDDHLRLIGKRVSVQNQQFRSNVDRLTKISCRNVAPTNHFLSQKSRLNDLSYGIKNLGRFLFHFVTVHVSDGRTDKILIARPRLHFMRCGKNRIARHDVGLRKHGVTVKSVHSHARLTKLLLLAIQHQLHFSLSMRR